MQAKGIKRAADVQLDAIGKGCLQAHARTDDQVVFERRGAKRNGIAGKGKWEAQHHLDHAVGRQIERAIGAVCPRGAALAHGLVEIAANGPNLRVYRLTSIVGHAAADANAAVASRRQDSRIQGAHAARP